MLHEQVLHENFLNIEDSTKAIELGQNAQFYKERGWAKLDLRMFQSAVEDFNKAIELNPNDPDYYVGRGQAMLECAGEDFHKALNIDPTNEEAIFFAGLIDDMHG